MKIEFRVWCNIKKKWLDPTEFYLRGDGAVMLEGCDTGQKRDEVFCLYTGLCDKNGKKIYEGDIISDRSEQFPIHEHDIVEYSLEHGGFRPFTWDGGCGCCDAYKLDPNEVEIIGNIYENHKLIEGRI